MSVGYRRLYVWVEGTDDERFFERTVRATFEQRYDQVSVVRYAKRKRTKIRGYLNSIKAMPADCIFLADINAEPCVTAKKRTLEQRHGIEGDRVIVVVMETESWYMAGLDDEASAQLGVPVLKDTDSLTKEDFNRLMPERFGSRINFMVEILKRFSRETARRKNRSFRYFARKHAL